MESRIIDWLFREKLEETRYRLIEHMAGQSDRTDTYAKVVVQIYQNYPLKSGRRMRVEAAAAKTNIYNQLRKIDVSQEMGTLFANDNNWAIGGFGNMVKIEQNFSNNQIGAV